MEGSAFRLGGKEEARPTVAERPVERGEFPESSGRAVRHLGAATGL